MNYKCFIISILFVINLNAQNNHIVWSPDINLKWEDFKGPPDYSSIHWASVYIDLNYQERKIKDSVVFTVKCLFSRPFSWVKYEMVELTEWDSLGLIHEKNHFDIGEIHARKLRKVFSETRFTNDELLNGKSDIIADSIKKLSFVEQNLYDKETEHGSNKEKQNQWNIMIAKELLELNSYRRETVVAFLKN